MSDASHELEDLRRAKGRSWAAQGFAPYGNDTGPLDPIALVRVRHENQEAPPQEVAYRVAGRVMLSRSAGKLRFVTLRDATGTLQLFVSKAAVSEAQWAVLDAVDLGDVLLAEGPPMKTKTGELSLAVRSLRPLTKSLIPPAKFSTTEDIEVRYRQRYRDLIENRDEVAEVFRARSTIVSALRSFLDARGFLEVETPLLHPLRGGATAKPFRTHHNALELELYLRVAPELYLKRLVVGGFERVYELGRAFRNEGISTRHNPEFTILEYYQAFATHNDLMAQTEAMFAHVDARVCERHPRFADGRSFELTAPWPRVRMLDAVTSSLRKRLPVALTRWEAFGDGAVGDWREAAKLIAQDAAELPAGDKALLGKCNSGGELLYLLYELFAEKHLVEDYRSADGTRSVPVFITDHPVETSPLARSKDPAVQSAEYGETSLRFTDRFELFVEGRELCNAFSELNDPDEQAERFTAQLDNRTRGDDEAMDFDADYVRALKHGMPPTAGFGLGVDRLAMLLTGARSIRDVLLFPLLRPESHDEGPAR